MELLNAWKLLLNLSLTLPTLCEKHVNNKLAKQVTIAIYGFMGILSLTVMIIVEPIAILNIKDVSLRLSHFTCLHETSNHF